MSQRMNLYDLRSHDAFAKIKYKIKVSLLLICYCMILQLNCFFTIKILYLNTFLLQVTNRQTSKTVNTIPVETPVMITTNELVDGVISNVDLLPVTALESVTPINMRIQSWRHQFNFERIWNWTENTHLYSLKYFLYSISCTICETLKPLYLIYDLDSHNVKIYSKVIHMLRVTTSLLRSLCKK